MVGRGADDRAFAQALERAAKRFGAKITEREEWTFDAGASRTDSGQVNEQQAVNAFTQVGDYDVLLVADEADEFCVYLNYRTYRPRPVVGMQALVATTWSGVFEHGVQPSCNDAFASTPVAGCRRSIMRRGSRFVASARPQPAPARPTRLHRGITC